MRAHLCMVIGASALALSACGKAEKAAPAAPAAPAAEQANNVLTQPKAAVAAAPAPTGTLIPKTAPAPSSASGTSAPVIPGGQVVSNAVKGLSPVTNAALVPEAPTVVGTGKPKLKPAPAGSAKVGAPYIPGGSVVSDAVSGMGQLRDGSGG